LGKRFATTAIDNKIENMAEKKKIGFTWYPKDWSTSDKVFELTLAERGLYREFIDMAMENDNNTKVNLPLFARRFNETGIEIKSMMIKLQKLELIHFENSIFVPSCQPRLNMINGAKKGGAKSRKPKVEEPKKPIKKKEVKTKVNISDELKVIIGDENKWWKFNDWIGYRKDIGKQVKAESSLKSLAKRFNKESYDKIKFVVDSSIESGYQGLFWDNYKPQNSKKSSRRVSL
jgi:hypothetical protein